MITNLRFFSLKKGFEPWFRRSAVYKAPIYDEKEEEIAKNMAFLVQTIAICVLTIDFSQSDLRVMRLVSFPNIYLYSQLHFQKRKLKSDKF